MEDKSDWSDDSDTEKPKKKSKTKKTDPNTEVLDEELRIVEGKYLDDGTLQIQVTEKQKEEKFGKNGKLCWQENPHNIPHISESNRLCTNVCLSNISKKYKLSKVNKKF